MKNYVDFEKMDDHDYDGWAGAGKNAYIAHVEMDNGGITFIADENGLGVHFFTSDDWEPENDYMFEMENVEIAKMVGLQIWENIKGMSVLRASGFCHKLESHNKK